LGPKKPRPDIAATITEPLVAAMDFSVPAV
jgi:hypothetical protein